MSETERLVLDEDGNLQNATWPAEALVEPEFLRSLRVRRETEGFGIYAVRESAVYREIPRHLDDGSLIRLQLVRFDPLFRANGGPLMDAQVSPEAASPTIAPLAVETNPPVVAAVNADPYAGGAVPMTELAQSKTLGGGISAPTQTVSNADATGADDVGDDDSAQPAKTPADPEPDGTAPAHTPQNAEAIANAAQIRDEFSRPIIDGAAPAAGTDGANTTEPGVQAPKGYSGAQDDGTTTESDVFDDAEIVDLDEQEDEPEAPAPETALDDAPNVDHETDETGESNAASDEVPLTESENVPEYTVQHRGRGSYSVMDADGAEAVDGLTKAEADEVKAMNAIDRAEFVRARQTKADTASEEDGRSEG